MRLPTAKALAPTSLHIAAALLSVCTRISLKSTPKRGSMKERMSEGRGLPPVAFWMRFSSWVLTVLSSLTARCTDGVVGLGVSCWGFMAVWGIAMTLAAIASASSSYLSPGVLTVSLACIDCAVFDVSDDLAAAAASSRAHRLIMGSFFIQSDVGKRDRFGSKNRFFWIWLSGEGLLEEVESMLPVSRLGLKVRSSSETGCATSVVFDVSDDLAAAAASSRAHRLIRGSFFIQSDVGRRERSTFPSGVRGRGNGLKSFRGSGENLWFCCCKETSEFALCTFW